MNTYYVVLKDLKATEVSVHAGFYSTGLPALTALCGMSHALQLSCETLVPEDTTGFGSDDPCGFVVSGTAISFIEARLAEGPQKRVNNLAGDKSEAHKPASFSYDPIGDLHFELILEVTSQGQIGDLKALLSSEEFRMRVLRLRLSGGAVQWPGTHVLAMSMKDALDHLNRVGFLLQDEYKLLSATLKLSRMSWMHLLRGWLDQVG